MKGFGKYKEVVVTQFLRLYERASILVRQPDGREIEVTADRIAGLARDQGIVAGPGITGGVGTVYAAGIEKKGNVLVTTILLDLTGLASSGASGDIIGKSGAGAAHLGQITVEKNGTLFHGVIECIEAPATGEPDLDLWAADEGTGAYDGAISALTGEVQLVDTGDWTVEAEPMTALPGDGQYLYLATASTDAGTYTAGKFIITLYGYAA